MQKKILLVEDDLILGETVAELLESENFLVTWVKDGQVALDKTYFGRFDLFLFDLNIPFINGFELLQSLRESGDITPAIFITAKADINSLKKGFDIGADDYMRKPFDIDELIIRIESLLKKSFKSYDSIINYGDIAYDIDKKVIVKDTNQIHLTPTQIAIVEFLLKNINKVVTIDEIISQTHDNFEGSIAALRVQISKIKKIGFNITNIRTVGYRLEAV